MRLSIVLFLLLFSAGFALPACSAAPNPEDPRLRALSEKFFAPCCWRESVAVHLSPEADKMRHELADLLKAGYSEQQIVDLYVARYGERILRQPRGERAFWLTVTPLAVLGLGSLLLFQYIRHSRRTLAATASEAADVELSDPEVDE